MDPIVGAALISGGSSLVGGMLGRSSANKAAKKQIREARHQFDQQMDYSVRRRVKDAKAAGIHPLYALGASPGASPTVSIAGQYASGSGLGDAIGQVGNIAANAVMATQQQKRQKSQDAMAREVHEAQLGNIKSQTAYNLALAQAAESRAKTDAANALTKRPGDLKSLSTPLGELELGPHVPQQIMEDQYGGIVGEAYGLTRFGRDVYRQYEGTIPKRDRRFYESRDRYRQSDDIAP